MPWYEYGLLFLAAGVAGAVNAVAGGGTLLTFPALLWAHQTAIVANATSTVALWPGQLSSLWGYRKQLAGSAKGAALLAVPSLLGGLFGAILFVKTDNATFAALVPYLILLATLLFVLQEPLARWSERRATPETLSPPMPPTQTLSPHHCDSLGPAAAFPVRRWLAVMAFQFFVATYGGYFGAGIGILMLAAFGFLGLRNIHQMNGLKNVNGLAINAVAATLFVAKGLVDWRLALLMASGAILGGYAGAGTAQRIGEKNVRRVVIVIGFSLSVSLFVRR